MSHLKISTAKPQPWLLPTLAAVVLFLLGLFYVSEVSPSESLSEIRGTHFEHVTIDIRGPCHPWGKAAGDINGDGLADLVVGGNARKPSLYEKILGRLHIRNLEKLNGELLWYENPLWIKHSISNGRRFSTDHEVIDVDGDGQNDVVSLTETQLLWFKNPGWSPTLIDNRKFHDIEVGDFDNDGDIDIVARNQSAFGGHGDQLFFYYQKTKGVWDKFSVGCPNGEGLKVADIDGDGRLDVVVNRNWYENLGNAGADGWAERVYSRSWNHEHTSIAVGDLNQDGRLDVVLTPAELAGNQYHISWFEAPINYGAEWQEHVVEDNVEAVHHSAAAADMDNDGDIDIVTAEMHQGKNPDEVKIYINSQGGRVWTKRVISRSGSHNLRIVDIDGDGDLDIFGANWSGEYEAVELWTNQTCKWERHIVDADKPWRSVFVTSADMDGDGYKDIVTGAWWYKNPGKTSSRWVRREIGSPANNMAAVYDFDGDDDLDILASQWEDNAQWGLYERILRKFHLGTHPVPIDGGFVWARNDGKGRFEIIDDVSAGEGDFLQGVALGQFIPGKRSVALSWHEPEHGIQILTISRSPEIDPWKWEKVSSVSQDEELSAGDIDRDGDLDLLLGTKWLRNDGGSWTVFSISDTNENPDRNRLVDMNHDGRLDAVIGYEAISRIGKVAWYEQRSAPTAPWIEHVIGYCIGPMSLDVADMDQDGDLDVVVGEHNLAKPQQAKMLIFKNVDKNATHWSKELVYVGDEHHDGAHVVDIDQDGDKDILSIGWQHSKVLLYENKCESCR